MISGEKGQSDAFLGVRLLYIYRVYFFFAGEIES